MKQDMMGWQTGSGISWTICKSYAPHSRQITTPVPHHSQFLQVGCPSGWPTDTVKALKCEVTSTIIHKSIPSPVYAHPTVFEHLHPSASSHPAISQISSDFLQCLSVCHLSFAVSYLHFCFTTQHML